MLFKQIEYFQAVVEAGNFYDAAENSHVSQSAISQQIKKLEDELGTNLLARHNRTFSLTPAGEYFYKKSLILRNDMDQMIRETKRLDEKNSEELRLGYYKGYYGDEFSKAVAIFSEKYPSVKISIETGSHDDLYHAKIDGKMDLSLSDQRRAFSDAYNNLVLAESTSYIEISSRNPLSRLESIELAELKNIPCILVINKSGRKEEQEYYEKYVGLRGESDFAESIQEARLKIITGRGYIPVDVINDDSATDKSVSRILLTRNGESIKKNYCAFWQKKNDNPYTSIFAEILKYTFNTPFL